MKRIKKGLFMLALLLGTTALLYGCRPRENEKQEAKGQSFGESTAAEPVETGPVIGVSIYRFDDNFMKLYRLELKQYLEENYHARVLMRNAGGDQAEQERQIMELIEEGCDGIIVNPVEAQASGSMADACAKARIPLVFINREPLEEEQKRWKEKGMAVSCIGTDSRQAGTFQGEIILETPDQGDKNGDGVISYAMITGEKDNLDSRYRAEYSVKALENGGMKTEQLFLGHGDWKEEKGKELARTALAAFGKKVEVIFCGNDAMANGALEAVEEAGLRPGKDVYLVGVDALEETVKAVKEGKIAGTVFNDYAGQSHKAAEALVKMIEGEETETRYTVDYIKIAVTGTFSDKSKETGK